MKYSEPDASKQELWLVPIYKGEPRKLDVDITNWVVGIGIQLSPDGRQIAYFSGKPSREAWVYENIAGR